MKTLISKIKDDANILPLCLKTENWRVIHPDYVHHKMFMGMGNCHGNPDDRIKCVVVSGHKVIGLLVASKLTHYFLQVLPAYTIRLPDIFASFSQGKRKLYSEKFSQMSRLDTFGIRRESQTFPISGSLLVIFTFFQLRRNGLNFSHFTRFPPVRGTEHEEISINR